MRCTTDKLRDTDIPENFAFPSLCDIYHVLIFPKRIKLFPKSLEKRANGKSVCKQENVYRTSYLTNNKNDKENIMAV